MTRRLVMISWVVVAAAAAFAIGPCGGKKVNIPDGVGVSTDRYTLLYSTLGYEPAGTKHILIRQTDAGAPVSEGVAFTWKLVSENGNQKASGRAPFIGTGWGVPLWLADISEVDDTGTYRLLVEAPDVVIATTPFRIEQFALSNATFEAVALHGPEARQAPVELDNGFYDSNTRAGDAAAHASLLVGLSEAYVRRRGVLGAPERERLRASIDRAVDYLILLTDAGTGDVRPRSDTRPFGRNAPFESAEVARGLAHYAATFEQEEPDKTNRAYRRATAIDRALTQTPGDYPAVYRSTVQYDLYRYGGDQTYLDGAIAAANEIAGTYDLRTMQRASRDGLPHMEGLYRLWKDLPNHPDHEQWESSARTIAGRYLEMLLKNPFHFVPPGVTTPGGVTPEQQWDEVATQLPPGDGDPAIVANAWFMARSVDALYLLEMTQEEQLEQMAAGSLNWITGTNAGIASQRAYSTGGAGALRAASFVTGVPGGAKPWFEWEWARPAGFGSLAAGFRGGLVYDDAFETGETSIADDGRWLYAMLLYEDALESAKRTERPPAAAVPAMHVASTESGMDGGVLRISVRVADAANQPVTGARVLVIWQGTHDPQIDPSDVVLTTECVTTTDGVCLTVIQASSVSGPRPITASVANIEHASLPWDINSDDPSRVATFP